MSFEAKRPQRAARRTARAEGAAETTRSRSTRSALTAIGAARDVLAAEPRVLKDPAAVVGVTQVTESGIKLGVQPWVGVQDVSDTEGALYRALLEHFRATGITLPVSYHEIRMVNGGAAAAAARA